MFSVSSALQAAAEAAAVKTGSDRAGTSAGPAAPSGEQVVFHALVAAVVEPKKCGWKGEQKDGHNGEKRKGQNRKVWSSMAQERGESLDG